MLGPRAEQRGHSCMPLTISYAQELVRMHTDSCDLLTADMQKSMAWLRAQMKTKTGVLNQKRVDYFKGKIACMHGGQAQKKHLH